MKTRAWVVFVLLVISLAGAANGAKIKADLDKDADFASFKTYAWGQNTTPSRQAAGMVIGYAIDHQLQLRGLQQTDVEHADLIVRYRAIGDRDINMAGGDPMYAAVGGAPLPGGTVWTSGFGAPAAGAYVKKGSLVVDIFDRQKKRLIWSAAATDTINDKTMKAIEQVNKIVATMFSHYPVKSLPDEKSGE